MGLIANSTKIVALVGASFALMAGSAFSENINSRLEGLSSTEKISVVLCVRGEISINYRDTVSHNLKNGGSDATWALKINAIENAQMSELAKAAGWSDMETYYKEETDTVELYIRGKLNFESYRLSAQQNAVKLKKILDTELARHAEHKNNFQTLGKICKDISSTVISKAKIIASK